ncbi:MAG: response regulator, partial [Spirochaetota bacterium]
MTKPSQTILIVEDQAGISEAEKTALLKVGYGVLTAATGEAAGEYIRADAGIDLVLMDIHLGDGVDGIETARDILRIRELPIIFVSSSTDLETIERIESVSSYGFVAKRAGVAVLDVSIRMAFRLFAVIKREKRIKAQLEATLDALPDQLFEVGADGSIHDHHSPRTELLYAGDASIVGKSIADIHPPAVARALMAAIAEADRDGRSTGTQFEMEVGIGKRWFEVSISRKNEPSNRPHFIMLKRDITERKQAELDLEAALGEKRLLLG